MDQQTFLELQSHFYDVQTTLIASQHTFPERLALSTLLHRDVLPDFAAFYRAGFFFTNPESYLPIHMTSGVGLPLRIVAYYGRQPIGYLSGVFDGDKFLIHHAEMSEKAHMSLAEAWPIIFLETLNNFALFLESYEEGLGPIKLIAFMNPGDRDSPILRAAGFTYTEDIYKGIPAFYIERVVS
ncbi:hypothetical protein AEA42_04390 [Shewanella sp. Sh95]|uniref:hypothetical protein n=1 Tax=Shewanella sp. Sh95 TaxID=1689868 RepID=UPI0006DA73DC|nr:hypothetical protein [Shewanella sp. Sh95]KPN78201.1 hypothetical protein AEA42_04390 [Shewanella sp. Sh95]